MSSLGKIWSPNEWGKLREIIIGSPRNAFVEDYSDISIQCAYRPTPEAIAKQIQQKMPQSVIDETLEDIDQLTRVFKSLGVAVHRAEDFDHAQTIKSTDWEVWQESGINVRDLTLIHGDLVIDCPTPTRCRHFESLNVRAFFTEYLRRSDHAWMVSAPKPRLLDSCYDLTADCGLHEVEPIFDAANCVRLGKDIVVDTNNTANRFGIKWLQQTLDIYYGQGKIKVHPLNTLSPDHLDVVLIPLREGTLLVNPEYVTQDNLPEIFRSWDIIRGPEMVPQGYSIGAPKASNWIGLNALVINGEEKTVLIEERQIELIRLLERKGFKPIPVSWRHGRDWTGGLHCVTLDVHREGELF